MLQGIKHLVSCRCVLQQFKKLPNPPQHQFTVFSVLENDTVKQKFAQCNNCGVIHKITDLCKSEILTGKEHLNSIVKVEDLRCSLPERLANLLEINNADIPTWEAVVFNYENNNWGSFVVISTDTVDGLKQGKYVKLLSDRMFKVETFSREDMTS